MKATALKFHPQTGKASSCTFPFVCHLMPSIELNNPCIKPLVCYKLPNVGNQGFTLIELIITVTIAGVMLALAIPGMGNFIQDHRLSGQANDLVADLNTARSEAIKRGENVTVCKQDSSSSSSQCSTTTASAWTPGRVMFLDSTSGTVSQVDTSELVLRNQQALAGNNTLTTTTIVTATSAVVSTNPAANLIVFTNAGQTTIGTGNETSFKFCDSRGKNKAITVKVNFAGRIRTDRTPPAACP